MPLYLVRHGQSEGNLQRIFQCHQDLALTALGVSQAQAAGHWFSQAGITFAATYASTLERAWHTADLIGSVLGAPAPIRDLRLMEFAGGQLTGLQSDELHARFPEYRERGLDVWGDLSIYGGEALHEIEARVQSFIADVEAAHDLAAEDVLVVSHGGTLHQFIKVACTYPTARVMMTSLSNCCIVKLEPREVGSHRIYTLSMLLPM
jgi:2,3-bisphosphoglycerate-dependent phosphoglycerate mutase